MIPRVANLRTRLAKAPATNVVSRLSRIVRFVDLVSNNPPNWLYTSGKPGRINPEGIECIYFSDSSEVAQWEFEDSLHGLAGKTQPATTYYAEVRLSRVLDLCSDKTRRAIGVGKAALLKNWRMAKAPTVSQLIGKIVSETCQFSAIRFPSKAAAARHRRGANIVIFQDCVKFPDHVRILGPTMKALQEWP